MATKRRRLSDLYVVGKEITFDDGTGDPIKVFVRKLNPMEHEKALKRANAVRASMMAAFKDPNSNESKELDLELQDFEREDIIQILLEEERAERRPIIEAEIQERDEWTEDGYLEGLVDAWTEGLAEEFAKDPEHPEAKRVRDEMDRLVKEVDQEMDAWLENYERDLQELSDDTLRDRVKKNRKNLKSNSAWFTEFRRSELWLSVKEEDKKTPYFQSREEVEELPLEVMMELVSAYKNLVTDPLEGKESRAQDDS